MYSLGLPAAQREEFEDTLLASHRIRVTLTLRDRDERILRRLEPRMLDGAITVDAAADVTRSLSATFLDPSHKLAFDANNPADAALFVDNFLQVEYGVYLETSEEWVDVPVFWGVVTGFSRSGPEVTVEAQGKEALALDPHLIVGGYTLRKGMTIKNAIRNVMNRLGETRYNVGMISGRLPKARTVIPGEAPWKVCVGGSDQGPGLITRASNNVFLVYDGLGRLIAKRRNSNSVWTFEDGQLTSLPGFKYDGLAFRNYAVVNGGVRKGSKLHARGAYALPPTHPLSAAALARHGYRRFLPIFEDNDALKTDAECTARAKQLVDAVAFEGVEASFECLPIPHLQEYDVVTLRANGYSFSFRAKQFTIPLTAESPMTMGSNIYARMPRYRRRT